MLINPNQQTEKTPDSKIQTINTQNSQFISSADDYLSKHLRSTELPDTGALHFTSNGRYALHDIIVYYANYYGPVHTIISSFNISVVAARKFIDAQDKGMFHSLAFILNASKKSNFMKAIRIIEPKFDVKFRNVHAKIALLWNDNIKIGILSTGNLSQNNNKERGIIYTDPTVFYFDYEFLKNLQNE